MKLSDDQITRIEKAVDSNVVFFATITVESIMEVCSDEQLDNQQRIYDMVCDHLRSKDLTQMVLDRLKDNMGVR